MYREKAIIRNIALILVSIVAFVFISLCAMSIAMPHHGMADCPYAMDVSAFCGMSADEHKNAWESLALGTIKRIMELLIVAMLVVVAFWVFLRSLHATHAPPGLRRVIDRLDNPERAHFRYLRFAFSRGILHSKAW